VPLDIKDAKAGEFGARKPPQIRPVRTEGRTEGRRRRAGGDGAEGRRQAPLRKPASLHRFIQFDSSLLNMVHAAC
jgi:hypothetical protein